MKHQQISLPRSSGTARVAKKVLARLERRRGKKFLDDAPVRRRYRGYT